MIRQTKETLETIGKLQLAIIRTLLFCALTTAANANIAVSLEGASINGISHIASEATCGWHFEVSKQITVTHLGLYDYQADGFTNSYPIGLWRLSDQELLTQGVIQAGTTNQLIEDFRYIDVQDVMLYPGQDYIIAFYTKVSEPLDKTLVNVTDEVFDPAVTMLSARWDYTGGEMGIPLSISTYYPDRYGPNFIFVPEPATICLLGFGALTLLRKHRA